MYTDIEQVDYVLAAVPSGTVLIVCNEMLKVVMRNILKIATYKTPEVCEYISCVSVCV